MQSASALEATSRPYTETITTDLYGNSVINRVYQNVGDGYGKIDKGFIAPSGFYLTFKPVWQSRQVESELVKAVTEILAEDRAAGYVGELRGVFSLYFKSSVPKKHTSIVFETYDDEDTSWATTYHDTQLEIEKDDLIIRNYDWDLDKNVAFSFPWNLFEIEPLLLDQIYNETDVQSYLEINLQMIQDVNNFNETKLYSLRFDLPTTHVAPVDDGTLLSLTCDYVVSPETQNPMVNINCSVNTYFASSTNIEGVKVYEYKADAMSGNVPANSTWALTIDGSINMGMEDSYMTLFDLPDEPFTLQAILTFTTRGGEKNHVEIKYRHHKKLQP